jgi:hypothetical protein
MKSRKIQCNMFKCFKNQSDTYHDTQTYYLMEKDSLPFQDQASVMDIVVDGMWIFSWKKGPSGAMLKLSSSRNSMSRTCGPRDMISLVTPRFGDNIRKIKNHMLFTSPVKN